MTEPPALHLVTDEEQEERKTLLTHPAFDGVWGHEDRMGLEDLKAYIDTWEAHTYRGVTWVAEHGARKDRE